MDSYKVKWTLKIFRVNYFSALVSNRHIVQCVHHKIAYSTFSGETRSQGLAVLMFTLVENLLMFVVNSEIFLSSFNFVRVQVADCYLAIIWNEHKRICYLSCNV